MKKSIKNLISLFFIITIIFGVYSAAFAKSVDAAELITPVQDWSKHDYVFYNGDDSTVTFNEMATKMYYGSTGQYSEKYYGAAFYTKEADGTYKLASPTNIEVYPSTTNLGEFAYHSQKFNLELKRTGEITQDETYYIFAAAGETEKVSNISAFTPNDSNCLGSVRLIPGSQTPEIETMEVSINKPSIPKQKQIENYNPETMVAFNSNDPIASVDSNGLVTAKNPGDTVIEVLEGNKVLKVIKVHVIQKTEDIFVVAPVSGLNAATRQEHSINYRLLPEGANEPVSVKLSPGAGLEVFERNGEFILKAVYKTNEVVTISSGDVSKSFSVNVYYYRLDDYDSNNGNTDNLIPVYRLYNQSLQEHLYTPDKNEVDNLENNGWTYEGIGWSTKGEGNPIYRLYNPTTNHHLYTSDLNEVNELSSNRGWQKDFDGNPTFYSAGDVPIYRLYNEGLKIHLLTKDANEYSILGTQGWNQESTAFTAAQ